MNKLSEYLDGGGVFVNMTDAHIASMATALDILLKIRYGERLCGRIIQAFVNPVTDEVSVADRQTISELVWLEHCEKWTGLFDFIDAEIPFWTTEHKEVETTFGKVVDVENGGTDTFYKNDTIAGFDTASELVADKGANDSNEYGKTTTSTDSGTEKVVEDIMRDQGVLLAANMIEFWNKNGIIDTLLKDAAHSLTLAVYDI